MSLYFKLNATTPRVLNRATVEQGLTGLPNPHRNGSVKIVKGSLRLVFSSKRSLPGSAVLARSSRQLSRVEHRARKERGSLPEAVMLDPPGSEIRIKEVYGAA